MNDINQEDEIIVEAEEWEPSKYYVVGQYFTINGELYKVLNSYCESCSGCDFRGSEHCGYSPCVKEAREDNSYVIFTLCDTLEEE